MANTKPVNLKDTRVVIYLDRPEMVLAIVEDRLNGLDLFRSNYTKASYDSRGFISFDTKILLECEAWKDKNCYD